MHRLYFLLIAFLMTSLGVSGQVYVEQFDALNNFTAPTGFTTSVANSELTLTGDGTSGPFNPFIYQPGDETGTPIIIDVTGTNKLFVRAKASSIGTELRVDVQDAAGFVTSVAGITKVLTNDYVTLEYDFTGLYNDGGFGGTPCNSMTAPCAVDGSMTQQFVIFVDPGVGSFSGNVVIDYISVGEDVGGGGNMSDIFQDHFDVDSSLTSMVDVPLGFTTSLQNGTEIVLRGDGTGGEFSPFAYEFRSPPSYESIDLDLNEGNGKVFIKMKSSVPSTVVRVDVQDINGFVSTQGSLQRIINEEYSVYEYDFTGVYADLGFGGTPCTMETAPCPLNSERIASLLFFIEPGVGAFAGDIIIDYISIGTSLEPAGDDPELVYFDRFNNNAVEFVSDGNGYLNSEEGTEWTITGDGTAGAFASVSYLTHDKATGEAINIDITPAKSRLFLKMRTNMGMEPVRVDLIDSSGFVSSITSLTKIVGPEYVTIEYNFDGVLQDGGFGGSPCDETTAPCRLDPTAISQLLFYIRAADGGFDNSLIIDYLSFGQQLGEDPILVDAGVTLHTDEMNNADIFLDVANGYTATATNGVLTLTGDGTAGPFTAHVYDLHSEGGDSLAVDAISSGDTLFIWAKASEAVDFRIDLQDYLGFATTNAGRTNTLGTEYQLFSYVYAGAYQDGGFGGTACLTGTGPCAVDGQRISNLVFYPAPTTGGFGGSIDIDWLSFGRTMLVAVEEVPELLKLRVFPNPAQDRVGVQFELLEAGAIGFRVYDGLGRLAVNHSPEFRPGGNQFEQLDLSALKQGVYHLQISYNGRILKAVTLVKQ